MNNKIITSTTALVDCIVDNNRFATRKLNAEQIGAENLRNWKDLINTLHKESYIVYAECENNDLSADDPSLNLTPVFSALRSILAEFGEVNGHKLFANTELATLVIGYSGKRGNLDSPALQLCNSKLGNRRRELAKFEKTNGVNPDAIKALQDEIADLEAERDDLIDSPDNRIKEPTRTTADAFRLDVEHRLARVIAEQKAKTWEQLEAEDAARKAERRAKTKAKNKAKKEAKNSK
jgi:hypothetical protein